MSAISVANTDQREFWNDLKGGLWVEWQSRLDAMLGPFGEKAIEVLNPRPGENVLEIGCGTGTATLAMAGRIGSTGRILAADISHPMLQKAIARAAAAQEAPITFVEADAQIHGFEQSEFDAVFSRFGVMFFENPIAAFQNILGALRPSGRLAFVCWADRADNPWVRIPVSVAKSYLELPPPPSDDVPGQFSMGNADRVRGILSDAGWTDIKLERFNIDHSIGADLADATSFSCRMGPMSEPFAQADEATQRKVTAAVQDALKPYAGPDGVRLGFSTWIVTAVRS
ncbi:MAG: class I SAM-dependent methyltransferase [Gammaproteobacteria bacterium]